MRSLLLNEARDRFDLLPVSTYDVTLDLRYDETFTSRTGTEVTSRGGETFLDLKPVPLGALEFDGVALPVEALDQGRYPVVLPPGPHRIVVDATVGFRNDGEGLHRAVDPSLRRVLVDVGDDLCRRLLPRARYRAASS